MQHAGDGDIEVFEGLAGEFAVGHSGAVAVCDGPCGVHATFAFEHHAGDCRAVDVVVVRDMQFDDVKELAGIHDADEVARVM